MTVKERDKTVKYLLSAAKELSVYGDVHDAICVALESQKYWMKEANRD